MDRYITFTRNFAVLHFITYFVVGLVTFTTKIHALGYYEDNPIEITSLFFRDSSSLIVMAGPLLQLFRAVLLTIAILPLRKVFLENKNGWMKLWLIFLMFAVLAPAGAAPGSVEGVIYTQLPAKFHLLYLPELIIQTGLFSYLFFKWERNELKNWMRITIYIASVLVFFMLVLGLLQNK